MKSSSLTINNLAFRWPGAERSLFHEISLELFPGSVSAVMGGNGTGKTTLLEVIAGRLTPETGEIHLGDKLVKPDDFNYLPQDSNRLLFSHLTIADNIELRRKINNKSLPAMVQALFEDDSVFSRYPSQCSGGQRQRAAVCRAVLDMPNFPVTLLDESFSQLSHDAKAILGPALGKTASDSNAIVLFVSHDLFEAMRYADQVLVLAAGQIISFDTSSIQGEDDCWRQSELRETILHSLQISNLEMV